jgi:hypothetical protein
LEKPPKTKPFVCTDMVIENGYANDTANGATTNYIYDIIIENEPKVDTVELYNCLNIQIHNCPLLKSIPIIHQFSMLESLSISCIDLTVFHIELPRSLLNLKVTYCGLKEFRPANVVPLAELDLSHNKLKEIPPCVSEFQEQNRAMRVSLKNNDFWFEMYSNLPSSMICAATVQELVRAHSLNLVSTQKMQYAIECLQEKDLDTAAEQLAAAVQLRVPANRYPRFFDVEEYARGREEDSTPTTYANPQNVHLTSVQASLKRSIYVVMSYRPKTASAAKPVSLDAAIKMISLPGHVSKKLREACALRTTIQLSEDITGGATMFVTMQDLLCKICCMLLDDPDVEKRKGVLAVLRDEIQQGIRTCFTGQMTRLVNALGGFYSDINVSISKNEEISNSIIALRRKYAAMYPDVDMYIAECIPVVWQLLEDMCVPEPEHLVWLEYV